MKRCAPLLAALLLYLAVLGPFTDYVRAKPFVEKLGTLPHPQVMSLLAGDQSQSLAAWTVLKVLLYYGTLVEEFQKKIYVPPDYEGMQSLLETAVRLDPYNMDAYYFANAVLVWDADEVRFANRLLEHGMRYRDWDWYLPFFAGFNYAYFLKDFEQAALYYRRAAELSGAHLYAQLAGRYLYESGQTRLAIAYLDTLVKSTRNEAVRQTFAVRLQALQQVLLIESAVESYQAAQQKTPESIQMLLEQGYLLAAPVDPYGGTFYLEATGKVRTTSQFSFAGQTGE